MNNLNDILTVCHPVYAEGLYSVMASRLLIDASYICTFYVHIDFDRHEVHIVICCMFNFVSTVITTTMYSLATQTAVEL